MGDLTLDNFVSISGVDPMTLSLTQTITLGIYSGQSYTFRYRAINAIGASGWSPIGTIQAA